MIDDYFQTVLTVLQASPYVKSHNVTFDRRSLTAGYIRGDVYFLDDSQLHFREFVNTESGIDRFTHVFHYQRADGSFVFRYDNTEHYPDLDNFPHHQHVGDEDHAISSAASRFGARDPRDRGSADFDSASCFLIGPSSARLRCDR